MKEPTRIYRLDNGDYLVPSPDGLHKTILRQEFVQGGRATDEARRLRNLADVIDSVVAAAAHQSCEGHEPK